MTTAGGTLIIIGWVLFLFWNRVVAPELALLKEYRREQLEILRETLRAQVIIAENSAKIATHVELIHQTTWDHWQWIRERT